MKHLSYPVEAERSHPAPQTIQPSSIHLLQLQEVSRVLKAVNPHKTTGPEAVLGKVLKSCVDQLSGVLIRMVNTSLTQATILSSLKAVKIKPVPKKTL